MMCSPTADTWAQPRAPEPLALPPKLPCLQLLEIESDESERLFSMNLMGTKPSFWSGQAAHMADTGQVLSGLSQAPSWPCSIKSGRRLQAGSQRCWQVFIRLLGVMWPSVLWVPHPSTWAMALMARRQVWAHAALLLPFPQIPLRRAAKLPLLSGLPLLHYKMSSAHLLASEASWESMGAFPPHPHPRPTATSALSVKVENVSGEIKEPSRSPLCREREHRMKGGGQQRQPAQDEG